MVYNGIMRNAKTNVVMGAQIQKEQQNNNLTTQKLIQISINVLCALTLGAMCMVY